MDPSNTSQMNPPNGHIPQSTHNGSSFNSFVDGLQSYGEEYGAPTDGTPVEYDFMWNQNLFTSQQDPGYSHQHAAPPQTFSHNTPQNYPPITSFDGIQSTLSPNPFNQHHPFDSRAMSQQSPSVDPRAAMPRPTPSPGPINAYQYQQSMTYPNRDQMLSPSSFNAHTGTIQQPQRPSSTVTPAYHSQISQSPYQQIDPRHIHYGNYQSPELDLFGGFQNPAQQPTSQFVSPSMLTANGMRPVSNGMPQQYQPRQQYSNSPYIQTMFNGDLRAQLQQQPPPPPPPPPPQQQQQSMHHLKQNIAPSPGPQTGMLIPARPIKPKAPKDPNAPKRSRGRPRKDGTMLRITKDGEVASSDSDSSDDLEIEEEEEEEMKPAPLVVSPPTESKARAVYDAVDAVWSPRNRPVKADKVKSAVVLYGTTLKQMRDSWKPENEALTAAENASDTAKAATQREKVEGYRNTMSKIMERTLLYGHPDILRNLPQNPNTLATFQTFLVDRVKRDDYGAPLVVSMLKVLGTFSLMDNAQLDTSKIGKIVLRLTKKGSPESKALAQNVLDNAVAATSRAKPAALADTTPASPKATNGQNPASVRSMSSASIPQRNDAVAGVKRPRDGETVALPVTKKVTAAKPIVQASKPLALQQAERRKLESAKQAVKMDKLSLNGASALAAAKPKVTVVSQPKPATSVFASLMSASKKPGTSLAEREKAAKTKPSAAPALKKEPSPPLSSTSKSSFSFLEALQGMDKPKELKQEKVEERALETEEERKKRLRKESRRKLRVSWRPDDSLVEIRTFTHDPEEEIGHADSMMRDVDDVGGEGRMLKLHMHDKDLDADEDEGEDLGEYVTPSEVDLSILEDAQRDLAYVKLGGKLEPTSQASEAQKKHEDSTIMVVYALPSDIPPSPKEPPVDDDDYEPDLAVTPFGEPFDETRSREAKLLAARPAAASSQNGAVDISAILQSIQHQQPVQRPTGISPELQRALGLLPQPAPQPPPAAAGADLTKILAVVNQMKAQQQPQYPATPAPAQAAPSAPNLAAIMAAMQAQNPGLPAGSSGIPNPWPGVDNEISRKHPSEDYEDDYGKKNKKKKASGGGDKPYNYKTMVCSFWQKGQCIKGDACTYRHDE